MNSSNRKRLMRTTDIRNNNESPKKSTENKINAKQTEITLAKQTHENRELVNKVIASLQTSQVSKEELQVLIEHNRKEAEEQLEDHIRVSVSYRIHRTGVQGRPKSNPHKLQIQHGTSFYT